MPEFGLLPKEYNVRIHGAYFPGRYYGKKDIPLMDVKLGQLGDWLSRRSKNPADMFRAFSRFWWRYAFRWVLTKKTTAAPYFHLAFSLAAIRYFSNYDEHKSHRHSKYH
uniref:F-type H+-transporting ATPase subunit f n=1 Tax=Schistosoma japonicum TaxID=6182 RepID=C1LAN3_SCHJA|nr:F-type H+-transporting ATPase subunit f [Schistosoma japonicum]